MKFRHLLLTFSILGFALLGIVLSEPRVDEDDEEEEEEGNVEVDENSIIVEEPPKEKPKYQRPIPKVPAYFSEPFNSKEEFSKRWVLSQAKKDGADESIAKYDGKWEVEEPKTNPIEGDLGLILKSKAKHHAVSALMDRPFEFLGKPFVVQYEVRFQNGMDCGGAYIKLLSKETKLDLKSFQDKTPYTIMFGPDKCGMDNKLHFIFRHKNPKTGDVEEKHAKKPSANIDSYFTDRKTHLYTLIVNPDNTFEVKIDNGVVNKGSLLEDMSPPVNPPKEIEDPNDKKPEDWDDREKIPDPDAKKPDDWEEDQPATIVDTNAEKPDGWLTDEPRLVPDPEASKPDDWDDEMDGEWEAPLIDNPKCKEAPGCGEWQSPSIPNPKYRGKWKPPMIENPNYKGVWKPRMIPNPAYFEDKEPYKMMPIHAVGLELWSMSDEIVFDNFLITDDPEVARVFALDSWDIKSNQERAASSAGRTILNAIKEATDERPWLWAVFILVVVLPIVLIVAYCCMSKGIWQTLMSAAKDHPWLWAIYVVVLLLPILLLSICLCPKTGPIKPEDIDAQRKKTDEPTPDDEEEKEEDKEGDEEAEDEEDKMEGEAEVEVGAGGDSAVSADKKATKADLEANDDGEEADAEEDAGSKGSPKKTSPRKRRARKE